VQINWLSLYLQILTGSGGGVKHSVLVLEQKTLRARVSIHRIIYADYAAVFARCVFWLSLVMLISWHRQFWHSAAQKLISTKSEGWWGRVSWPQILFSIHDTGQGSIWQGVNSPPVGKHSCAVGYTDCTLCFVGVALAVAAGVALGFIVGCIMLFAVMSNTKHR